MSDTTELNDKLVSELREIAKSLGIAEAEELRKAQLISAIVEQQNLIEAARAQQSTVENNYAPIQTADAEASADGEKSRKRIRTIKTKSSTEPRVEVPLDDTNLFNGDDDDAQQQEDAEEQETVAVEEPVVQQEGEAPARVEEPFAEGRPQKIERRVNQNNNPQKKPGSY